MKDATAITTPKSHSFQKIHAELRLTLENNVGPPSGRFRVNQLRLGIALKQM